MHTNVPARCTAAPLQARVKGTSALSPFTVNLTARARWLRVCALQTLRLSHQGIRLSLTLVNDFHTWQSHRAPNQGSLRCLLLVPCTNRRLETMRCSWVDVNHNNPDGAVRYRESGRNRRLAVRPPCIEQNQPAILPISLPHICRQLGWTGHISGPQHL